MHCLYLPRLAYLSKQPKSNYDCIFTTSGTNLILYVLGTIKFIINKNCRHKNFNANLLTDIQGDSQLCEFKNLVLVHCDI